MTPSDTDLPDGPTDGDTAPRLPTKSAPHAPGSGTEETGAYLGSESAPTKAHPAAFEVVVELRTAFGDRYALGPLLGRGGFGTVYRAHDRRLSRDVAIKASQPRSADPDQLLREARSLAQLRHPGIVTVHDVAVTPTCCLVVSELLRGPSLARWVEGRRPEPAEAVRIVAAVADALAHAHERSIVHRDVKPSNVVFAEDDRPALVDFGLALSDLDAASERGVVSGTPAYMSPEQAGGRGHRPDGRTDIYGLAATLYAMLCGRPPFRGRGGADVLRQVREDEPQPVRQLRPDVPPELEAVCLKGMAKNPGDRYHGRRLPLPSAARSAVVLGAGRGPKTSPTARLGRRPGSNSRPTPAADRNLGAGRGRAAAGHPPSAFGPGDGEEPNRTGGRVPGRLRRGGITHAASFRRPVPRSCPLALVAREDSPRRRSRCPRPHPRVDPPLPGSAWADDRDRTAPASPAGRRRGRGRRRPGRKVRPAGGGHRHSPPGWSPRYECAGRRSPASRPPRCVHRPGRAGVRNRLDADPAAHSSSAATAGRLLERWELTAEGVRNVIPSSPTGAGSTVRVLRGVPSRTAAARRAIRRGRRPGTPPSSSGSARRTTPQPVLPGDRLLTGLPPDRELTPRPARLARHRLREDGVTMLISAFAPCCRSRATGLTGPGPERLREKPRRRS